MLSDHPSLPLQSRPVALRPSQSSHRQIWTVIRCRRRCTRDARTRIGLVCSNVLRSLARMSLNSLFVRTRVSFGYRPCACGVSGLVVDVFWKMTKHTCSPYLRDSCVFPQLVPVESFQTQWRHFSDPPLQKRIMYRSKLPGHGER